METRKIQTITIDLKQTSVIPLPSFIQHDTNILEILVKDNEVDADLSNVGRIVVNYKRPDKKVISRLLTFVGNKVTYEIGLEEMEIAGRGDVELNFFSSDNLQRISTMRFKIYFNESIGTDSIYENTDDLNVLQELFVEVDAVIERLNNTDVSVLDNKIGVLTNLNTTNKSSLVNAVNETVSSLADIVHSVANFGAKGDGVADDTAALNATKDFILANGGVFFIPKKMTCLINGNVDLSMIKEVRIEGNIKGTNVTDTLIVGYSTKMGTPTTYYINEVKNAILKLHGVMAGEATVNYADHFLIFADGNDDTKYSTAYSRFTLGRIKKLEITSVAGTNSAWINENKFYGGRIDTLIIGGAYPHNNNIFYGTMFENFTADINNGTCNYFYDARLEGTINITFGTGTANNYFFRSHYSTKHAYLQNIETYGMTIVNNGFDNGVFATPDLTHRKETFYELSPLTYNFKIADFIRGDNELTIRASYREFYDTGLVELTNPIGIVLKSDKDLFNVFLYAYDENKTLITTEPVNFTNLNGGSWDGANNRYHFNSSMVGTGRTGIPIYPNGTVKYFRYVVRTGASANQTFRYLKLIKIEPTNVYTKINPLTPTKCTHTAKPDSGTWKIGDYVTNINPTVQGATGSQYVIKGWLRITDGTAFAGWVEDRALTGT